MQSFVRHLTIERYSSALDLIFEWIHQANLSFHGYSHLLTYIKYTFETQTAFGCGHESERKRIADRTL